MRPPLSRCAQFVVLILMAVSGAAADEPKGALSGDYIPVVQAIDRIRQQTEDVKAHNFQAMAARADHWQGAGADAFRAQFRSGRLRQNSDRLIGQVRDSIIDDLNSRDPNSLVSVKEVENYSPAFDKYTLAIRDALWGEAKESGLNRAAYANDRAFQRAVQAKLDAKDWREVIEKIEPTRQQILKEMADPHGDPNLPGPVRLMDTDIRKQLDASLIGSQHAGNGVGQLPPAGGTPPSGSGGVTPNSPRTGPAQDAGNRLAFGDVGGASAVLGNAAQHGSADAQSYAMMGSMAYDEGRYAEAVSAARSALQLDPHNNEANTVLHFSEGRVEAGGGGGLAGKEGGEHSIAGGGAGGGGRATFGGFVGVGGGAAGGGAPRGGSGSNGLVPSDAQRNAAARLSGEQAGKAAQNAIGLRDYTGAMAFVERGLALNPKDPALIHLRGTIYAKQHDYTRALADEKAALELMPKDPEILRALGQDQLRGGLSKEALATANAYLEAHPNEAFGYALRAQAYARLGDHDAYLADMRRAAELDPYYQEAAAHPSAIQNPTDADLLFLFPGEEGPKTAAAPAPDRGRQFSWVVGASIVGGLLMAFGLLQTVLAPLKEQVSSVFTRLTRTGPTVGALDGEALAAAAPTGLIRGQYEITRPIGSGGMGMVYEGTDRSLGRRVAIKKMRDELRTDPRERARFVSEAKTVAALHHPNIVDIFAIADDGDDVHLIFEFVDGRTVHDLTQASGKLAPEVAARIVSASADALEYAHSKGVIHRDMKPSNIMVDGAGRVKVMDFGIARMAKDVMTRYTNTLTVVGTPPYMAPEQEQGQVRRESDVYALAVCAYEMLTGKLPFGGIGGGMLLNKINMSYIPPSRENAALPAALDDVFARAFKAFPEDRYRTPKEFADALRSALPAGVRA